MTAPTINTPINTPIDTVARPERCPTPVVLAAYAPGGQTGDFAVTPCRRWACPSCGRRRAAIWRRFATEALAARRAAGSPAALRLVTITFPAQADADFRSASHAANVSQVVARWADRVRRSHSPRLEYLAVKEATKRGRLHVHLLTVGPYLRLCPSRCSCRQTGPERCPRHGACVAAGTYHVAACLWRGATVDATGADVQPGSPSCTPQCHNATTCARACHRPAGCIPAGARHCPQAIAHDLGAGWLDVRRGRGAPEQVVAYLSKYLTKEIGRPWPTYARRASYSRHFPCTHRHTDTARHTCDHSPTPRPTTGRLDDAWRHSAFLIAMLYYGALMPDPAIVWRHVPTYLVPFDPAAWRPPPRPLALPARTA